MKINMVDRALTLWQKARANEGETAMGYVIFDLDGTVICSAHRQATKPCGSLDLAHWIDNAKPELIYQDGLLPLARSMRAIKRAGHTVIVCTSRCMQQADFDFLHNNDLRYDVIFSRPGRFVGRDDAEYASSYYGFVGDAREDEVIKAEQLSGYFASQGYTDIRKANVIMFDDNLKVIRKMQEIGIDCLNATNVNRHMRAI
jgi:hypothetical protein